MAIRRNNKAGVWRYVPETIMKIKMFKMLMLLFILTIMCGCDPEPTLNVLLSGGDTEVIGSVPDDIATILWGDLDALTEQLAAIDETHVWWDYLTERVTLIRAQYAYYQKYINAGGVAVIGAADVPDRFFYASREMILGMTSKRPELLQHLTPQHEDRLVSPTGNAGVPRHNFRMVIVLAGDQPLPPDIESVGLGWCGIKYCVASVRGTSSSESIRLSIFAHEFAHALHYAIRQIDPTIDARLQAAYDAVANDVNGYWGGGAPHNAALEHAGEYWAFSVNRWFRRFTLPTRFGEQHHTRFRERDPLMYALLSEWFDFRYLGDIESKRYE